MKNATLLKTGIVGSAIAALCCFTPLLVTLFGAIGLATWVGHLDSVLVSALFLFLALTIYAFLKKDKDDCCKTDQHGDA